MAVGLVLADSSVVVLALPEIYRDLDVSVAAVTWVLVAFNLVLALAALPAAQAARRLGPARVTCAGLAVFALASLACGLASGIELLLAARCVQAIGGAAALCAALELLPSVTGSEAGAASAWARAGTIGAALGPGVGGLLTELISWESIFLLQVPVAAAIAVALAGAARDERSEAAIRSELGPTGRPHLAANLALGLVSAALAAALFLVVLLLIEGWRLTPIVAAAAVSAMPIAALASGLAGPGRAVRSRAARGSCCSPGASPGSACCPTRASSRRWRPRSSLGPGWR